VPERWIRDKHPGTYFRELSNRFLGQKYINSLIGDPDPGSAIRDGKSWIRDKHPGSYFRELRKRILGWKYINSWMGIEIRDPGLKKADPGSGINYPDPQVCFFYNPKMGILGHWRSPTENSSSMKFSFFSLLFDRFGLPGSSSVKNSSFDA
jgi:hypothetical protein